MSVNTLWKGERAWREALTFAGVALIPVVSWGTGRNTHVGVGQNQAGVAGRAGKRAPAPAGFTRGVTPCRDSKSKHFCSIKGRSLSKFQNTEGQMFLLRPKPLLVLSAQEQNHKHPSL